jgi:hypothetical protein
LTFKVAINADRVRYPNPNANVLFMLKLPRKSIEAGAPDAFLN